MKHVYRSIIIAILVALQVFGGPSLVFGDTMSSTSFVITSDDLTAGGGNINSSSFAGESDVGGMATGEDPASSTFRACAGYPCSLTSGGEGASIAFTVLPNSVNLGTLTTGLVATGTATLTTTENAGNGYQTTIVADGQFRNVGGSSIPDVSDGSVTAGAGEYGIGLTGSDRAFADDRSVTTTERVVASNSGAVTGSNVVVTFKAAISNTDSSGSYNQTATFVCTGTF